MNLIKKGARKQLEIYTSHWDGGLVDVGTITIKGFTLVPDQVFNDMCVAIDEARALLKEGDPAALARTLKALERLK